MANPYYSGPISDHYDGERFRNYAPRDPHRTQSFWKWQLTSKPRPWPFRVDPIPQDVPPPRVDGNALRVTFVGHATALVQTAGRNILTDPVWSMRASPLPFMGPRRVCPAGVAFEKLPKIDVVIVSHNHYDHMDIKTLKKLAARDNPLFVTPLGNDTIMKKHIPNMRVRALDWGDAERLQAVSFHAEPAQHWSMRRMGDRNKALWAAFVISAPGGNIYFSADTGYADHFRKAREKFGHFRFALIPIGAYEPRWFMRYSHCDPQEAVKAYEDLGSPLSLGIHFNTFRLSDEGYDDPVAELRAELAVKKIPETQFRALPDGSFINVP